MLANYYSSFKKEKKEGLVIWDLGFEEKTHLVKVIWKTLDPPSRAMIVELARKKTFRNQRIEKGEERWVRK